MHENAHFSTELRTEKRAGTRARLRRNRTVAGAISVLLAIGVAVLTIGSASADPSAGDWQKLRDCESGGDYSIDTGNGYYGAYQFDLGTWQSVGGTGLPSDANPATQDALAYQLWQQNGWSPWTCASIVGLPAGGSGGPARAPVAPRAVTKPVAIRQAGRLQTVTDSRDTGKLTVTGWAADLNTANAQSSVRITVNGVATDAPADTSSPSAPVAGPHGFSVAIPSSAGLQRVCAAVLPKGAGAPVNLGCMNTVVAGEILNRQSMTLSHGRVVVSGWVYDNTAPSRSTKLVISVNAAHYKLVSHQASADVDEVFGIAGRHRFSGTYNLTHGKNIVCMYAVGANPKNVKLLECGVVNS